MCEGFTKSVTSILAKAEGGHERPFTVLVEGNIGLGKSTYLKQFYNHREEVEVIKEPVDKWTNLKGHNLLIMFYEHPQRLVYCVI